MFIFFWDGNFDETWHPWLALYSKQLHKGTSKVQGYCCYTACWMTTLTVKDFVVIDSFYQYIGVWFYRQDGNQIIIHQKQMNNFIATNQDIVGYLYVRPLFFPLLDKLTENCSGCR